MNRLALFVPLASLLVAQGCVSLGTHEELQRAHKETQTRLAEQQLETAARTKQVNDEKKRADDLAAALASEQAKNLALTNEQQKLTRALADADGALKSTRTDLTNTQGELAQLVKDKSALKSSVEDMRKALDELAKRKAESDKRIAEYKALLARFQALIDAGKLKVKIVDGRMVVQLQSDVLFSSGSASLSKDGRANIVEVAAVLASIPERKFQVEGHTDNVPINTQQFPSNWELASARALTVTKAMVEAGLPAARVSAASFGAEKPAATNDTPEGKAQNRRIEIVVVPDLSSLPGFDELSAASR
jgi:chemotaxis protein MotB